MVTEIVTLLFVPRVNEKLHLLQVLASGHPHTVDVTHR